MSREMAPFRSGSNMKMDMVGHEAKGMDTDLAATGQGILDPLDFGVEDALTPCGICHALNAAEPVLNQIA